MTSLSVKRIRNKREKVNKQEPTGREKKNITQCQSKSKSKAGDDSFGTVFQGNPLPLSGTKRTQNQQSAVHTHTHKRRQTYTLQMKQKAERERQWNSSPHSSKYGRVCQEQSTRNDGFVGTHTQSREGEKVRFKL